MVIKKRGALQISFGWLFAILAGIFILALAVFIATRFIGTGEIQSDTQTAKTIGVILNELETTFESGSSTPMTLITKTRIGNTCDDDRGNFGTQFLNTSQFNFGKWTSGGVNIPIENRYVFSGHEVEGKKFYFFIVPFDFPFKTADIIILLAVDDSYCFVDAPSEVARDIRGLNIDGLRLDGNCLPDSKKICFNGNSGCYANVDYSDGEGVVRKGNKQLGFYGNLIYGAIFSDNIVYECQVKRLMKRVNVLSKIYRDKSTIISARVCNTNIEGDLLRLESDTKGLTNSLQLDQFSYVYDINEKNGDNTDCKLW